MAVAQHTHWALRRQGGRPTLSPGQAARFARSKVLALTGRAGGEAFDPWHPAIRRPETYDYLVDPKSAQEDGCHASVQGAVDAAVRDARTAKQSRRVRIALAPGQHAGPVLLPAPTKDVSLTFTVYGLGQKPSDTVIEANIDAQMPGTEYAARFGAHFEGTGPEARQHFIRNCGREVLTTGNTAVLRAEADGTEIYNMTLRNSYNADRVSAAPAGAKPNARGQFSAGQHQAVAFHNAGADKVLLANVHLQSLQDTLYLQSPDKRSTARSFLVDCDIEGDVDFIFGQATAFFQCCTIRSLGGRGATSWATAPATNIHTPFGFVFDGCCFVSDGQPASGKGSQYLGRQWFEGVRSTPYGRASDQAHAVSLGAVSRSNGTVGEISLDTLLSVGKCILLNARVGPHINPAAPWDDWCGPGYHPDGTLRAGGWHPRYRPFQTGPSDFHNFLRGWDQATALNLAQLDPDEVWLGEFNTTHLGEKEVQA